MKIKEISCLVLEKVIPLIYFGLVLGSMFSIMVIYFAIVSNIYREDMLIFSIIFLILVGVIIRMGIKWGVYEEV